MGTHYDFVRSRVLCHGDQGCLSRRARQRAFREALNSSDAEVELDLALLDSADADFAGDVVSLAQELRGDGRSLRIVGASTEVVDLLRAVGARHAWLPHVAQAR